MINESTPLVKVDISLRLFKRLLASGCKSCLDVKNLSTETLSKQEGAGKKTLKELQELKEKNFASWPVRKRARIIGEKRKLPPQAIKVVIKLVKKDTINYARDLPMFRQAYDLAPDMDFWLALKPKYQSYSMAAYLSAGGRKRLEELYCEFLSRKKLARHHFQRKPPPELASEKLGEDIEYKKTKRNIKNSSWKSLLTKK